MQSALSHLRSGLVPSSGLGHAKGSPNAERREDKIPGPLPQLPVHRERKVVVVLGERLRPAGSGTRVRRRGVRDWFLFAKQSAEPHSETCHVVLYEAATRSAASGARLSSRKQEPLRAARRLQRDVGRSLSRGLSV